MRIKELRALRLKNLNEAQPYAMLHHTEFDYSILSNISVKHRTGRGSNASYNDVIIMADTETSKKHPDEYRTRRTRKGVFREYQADNNHIVAWTISLRAYNRNIVTLYGHKPSTMIDTFILIQQAMKGEQSFIYFHNLAYDYVFLRKFLFKRYGYPVKQLATKSHYPINIEFENGLILKDSMILAQRGLERWADDLNVEHRKAVGKWDYNKIRTQSEEFTKEELEYIENDTLAGVECIDAFKTALNKELFSMPYTATGIPREEIRKIGKKEGARDLFLRHALTYEQQQKIELVYHGGFTHSNRHYIERTVTYEELRSYIQCGDFASSYPYVLLAHKYPSGNFVKCENRKPSDILKYMNQYAFMFKLVMIRPHLKDDYIQMPTLQLSKCTHTINAICDNGRILAAAYAEIYLTEMDLAVICEQYEWQDAICVECEFTTKDYLPRWFTDYIFKLFTEKTKLKDGDAVLYAIAKSRLNSLYGMCVQRPVKEELEENYETGEYTINEEFNAEYVYNKYIKNPNTILPYQWGVWCTAYAFYNLHQMGKCIDGIWLYSDTDSCYGTNWNKEKVNAYNENCKNLLRSNGYGAVLHNNREYWLGIIEHEEGKDDYTEFRVMGAKRYAGRCVADNKIHITVAGVPKKGSKCLNDNLDNFCTGAVFSGAVTGKKTHTYLYVDDIYIDEEGNETADSVDLSECDYELDSVEWQDWQKFLEEEIEIEHYRMEDFIE